MNLYDRACRGWTPDEGPPVIEKYPLATWAALALPVLATFAFLIGSVQR